MSICFLHVMADISLFQILNTGRNSFKYELQALPSYWCRARAFKQEPFGPKGWQMFGAYLHLQAIPW